MDYKNKPDWRESQEPGWRYFRGKPWSILDILDVEKVEQKGFVAKGGSAMERKIFDMEIKSVDPESLTIDTCISSERLDRVGDIMIQNGMEVEEGSKPVVLMAHGFSSMGQEPIAKILRLWQGEQGGYRATFATIQFFNGPDERRLYDKVIQGYLPNCSIGYIADEFQPINNGNGRRVTKWRLLELSLVGVPTQPDAHVVESGEFVGMQCKFFGSQPSSTPRVEDLACYVKGKYLCTFGQLGEKILEIQAEVIRKEFRRVMGKID